MSGRLSHDEDIDYFQYLVSGAESLEFVFSFTRSHWNGKPVVGFRAETLRMEPLPIKRCLAPLLIFR